MKQDFKIFTGEVVLNIHKKDTGIKSCHTSWKLKMKKFQTDPIYMINTLKHSLEQLLLDILVSCLRSF